MFVRICKVLYAFKLRLLSFVSLQPLILRLCLSIYLPVRICVWFYHRACLSLCQCVCLSLSATLVLSHLRTTSPIILEVYLYHPVIHCTYSNLVLKCGSILDSTRL